MLQELKASLGIFLLLTFLTGAAYPLAVTLLGQAFFPYQAQGSLIEKEGRIIGSELIAQEFKGEGYFHSRPSATTPQSFNAANSGASNLAPSAKALKENVETLARGQILPGDRVTASASGLDPHISPANAASQIARVALARRLDPAKLQELLLQHIEQRDWGFLGEARVNVLKLNLALDGMKAIE